MEVDLTDAQRAFVEGQGDVFVQACPGSGKTRAIIHRYLKREAEEQRKGIALISFTNVAIDEVKRRCGGSPGALRAPNFVGTFDSFINRFISGPLYARNQRRALSFVESWDSLPSGWLQSGQFKIGLEWFDFSPSGDATFVPERVRDLYASSLIKHVEDNSTVFCNRATGMRKALLYKHGVASSSASRWLATTELAKPATRNLMTGLMASRFVEVIVDEAQDCGEEELAILTFLRQAGVAVTLVADRDQAIFEFRRAQPSALKTFAATLRSGRTLDGNFRSSPSICRLNDSLRHGTDTDKPVGLQSSVATAIQLFEFRQFTEVAVRFGLAADAHGIAKTDFVVLAHKRSDARKAAGAVSVSPIGEQKVVKIADAGRILRLKYADPRMRLRAIGEVQSLLLGLIEGNRTEAVTTEDLCEELGVDQRWLRESALRVIMAADPSRSDRVQYTARVQAVVGGLAYPQGLPLRTVTSYLTTPNEVQWAKLDVTPQDDCLNWSTIHSVKGQEFPGVGLVIPSRLPVDKGGRNAVDHWTEGSDAEQRRVLYVGASRAQKLLVLAVHRSSFSRVTDALTRDGVPFSRITA